MGSRFLLWWRWMWANALGEMVGLGLTFLVGYWAISNLGEPGLTTILLTFGVAVLSGTIEATIVGLAQHWAMHPWFPGISRLAWWLATLVGALIAYVLGYLPSTLMDLGEQAGEEPMIEPEQWVVLLLAAGMGAVGGAVLASVQWLVLRGKVRRAGWWIPANMLAWTVGMPVIFYGIDLAQMVEPLWQAILLMAGALLICGSVVGLIHGAFLVWMAEPANKT